MLRLSMRYILWITALGAGAVLGVATAGGDHPKEAPDPHVWIERLSDPDWRVRARATEALRNGGDEAYKALFTVDNPHPEARFRVAMLKKEMAPRYGAWNHALEAGRKAFDAGEMERALEFFLIAARKNEQLRTDAWLARVCTEAWNGLPATAKDPQARLDWELYLCGEYDHLADRCLQSDLRPKALFLAARYDEVIDLYPDSPYAPLARYSLTAGHPYFQPPAFLEVDDPEREVEEWPRFLREHPGHPGSDDAAYRMGRALENLSRYREAVIWLMRSARLPDGEFRWKGPLRAIYVMDARASLSELEALDADGVSEDLREVAALTLAVRSLRRDDLSRARDGFADFLARFPRSAHREKVRERLVDLEETLLPLRDRVEAGENADEALYETGRYFYHRLLSLYNPAWEGNRVNYFSYEVNCLGRSHAFRDPEYFESHNNYLRAAGSFDRLWKEFRDSPRRAAALYSSGTAHLKAVTLNRFSVFRRTREQLLNESIARYERLVREHADDPLAEDAKTMIRTVRNLLAKTD